MQAFGTHVESALSFESLNIVKYFVSSEKNKKKESLIDLVWTKLLKTPDFIHSIKTSNNVE